MMTTSSPGSCKNGQNSFTLLDEERDGKYLLFNTTGAYFVYVNP